MYGDNKKVSNQTLFINDLKQKNIKDCSVQNWNSKRCEMSKLKYYKLFKREYELYVFYYVYENEKCLLLNRPRTLHEEP